MASAVFISELHSPVVLFGLGVAAAASGAYGAWFGFTVLGGPALAVLSALIGAVLFVGLVVLLVRRQLGSAALRMAPHGRTISVISAPDGLIFRLPHGDTALRPGAFTRIRRHRGHIVFVMPRRLGTIAVPESMLAPREVNAFISAVGDRSAIPALPPQPAPGPVHQVMMTGELARRTRVGTLLLALLQPWMILAYVFCAAMFGLRAVLAGQGSLPFSWIGLLMTVAPLVMVAPVAVNASRAAGFADAHHPRTGSVVHRHPTEQWFLAVHRCPSRAGIPWGGAGELGQELRPAG